MPTQLSHFEKRSPITLGGGLSGGSPQLQSIVLFNCDNTGVCGMIIQRLCVLRYCASITGQPGLGLWGH